MMCEEHNPLYQQPTKLDTHGSGDEPDTIQINGQNGDTILSLEEAQAAVGDRYRIQKLAGKGGMGQVFVAEDIRLERPVAIKFIDGPITDDRRRLLLQEARSMAGLRHPSICPVHEAMIESSKPFIVMGWIDGVPLDESWRDMALDDRLSLLERIVEAVNNIHSAGLTHLDIKPTNILVDRNGTPVLVDFGLASSQEDSHHRSSGGTPGFAAPEQFDHARPTGPASDVHALGVLLYLAMTDEIPWKAESARDLIVRCREEEPRLPEELSPGTPWPLQKIALSAIEHDPTLRYADAQLLLQDIGRYKRGETVSARPSMLMDRFHEQVRRRQEETEAWSRQGLVTHREAELLDRVYDRMQRPESHWIVDSRRLTISQVLLYLGGWLIVLAMTIGAGFSWDALESVSWLRYAIPTFTAACVLTLGIVLLRLGHPRIALGYLFTACLLVPVVTGLFLVERSILNDRESQSQFLTLVLDIPPILTNLQLLLCGISLTVAACIGRQFLHTSAFSPLAVIGIAITAMSAWASMGWMEESHGSWALFGTWVIVIGAAFLFVGIPLNRRQHTREKTRSPHSTQIYDAWSLLTGGSLLCVIGLFLTAWNSPSMYLPGLLPSPEPNPYKSNVLVISNQARAAAFIINGLLLLALSWGLTCVRTTACNRLAELLRWIIPAHIIGGLIELALATWSLADLKEYVSTSSWFWLGAATLVSLVFAIASVHRQWRPFLVSGLLGVATTYTIMMSRLRMEFRSMPERFDAIAIGTVIVLAIIGIGIMLISPRIRSRQPRMVQLGDTQQNSPDERA
ncbi:MAG: hypothetical protein CMJ29_08305 [Phycisphaerae bacterium]|nr:hypothetical protein [Phycisphaerae bacterium]